MSPRSYWKPAIYATGRDCHKKRVARFPISTHVCCFVPIVSVLGYECIVFTNLHFPSWNWNLEMLVFEEREKTEYPGKNLSEQRREPTTNSTHIWRRVQESNPGDIGGRRALLITTAPSLFPSINILKFRKYQPRYSLIKPILMKKKECNKYFVKLELSPRNNKAVM